MTTQYKYLILKPKHAITSIKQSPVLKYHLFRSCLIRTLVLNTNADLLIKITCLIRTLVLNTNADLLIKVTCLIRTLLICPKSDLLIQVLLYPSPSFRQQHWGYTLLLCSPSQLGKKILVLKQVILTSLVDHVNWFFNWYSVILHVIKISFLDKISIPSWYHPRNSMFFMRRFNCFDGYIKNDNILWSSSTDKYKNPTKICFNK